MKTIKETFEVSVKRLGVKLRRIPFLSDASSIPQLNSTHRMSSEDFELGPIEPIHQVMVAARV